jgi:HSP20 family protein
MLEPTNPSSWRQSLDVPSRLFGEGYTGSDDYDLYEEDDAFVLSIDAPGFDREEIDLTWDRGVLNVAADHVDEERGRKRTFHRRFRFPKDVDNHRRRLPERRPRSDPPHPAGHRTPRRAHPDRGLRLSGRPNGLRFYCGPYRPVYDPLWGSYPSRVRSVVS